MAAHGHAAHQEAKIHPAPQVNQAVADRMDPLAQLKRLLHPAARQSDTRAAALARPLRRWQHRDGHTALRVCSFNVCRQRARLRRVRRGVAGAARCGGVRHCVLATPNPRLMAPNAACECFASCYTLRTRRYGWHIPRWVPCVFLLPCQEVKLGPPPSLVAATAVSVVWLCVQALRLSWRRDSRPCRADG